MADHKKPVQFDFDNSFARDMEAFYVPVEGDVAPLPEMIKLNIKLAETLGLDTISISGLAGAKIFSGSKLPMGAAPLAQVYAGHQFGGFSPQLGDGRAMLLGELVDGDRQRLDIQLKGSGRTPFSRGGDGKATLGPVLREYIVGEAMHALGIPTTRALAAVTTGENVMRETSLPGAVLTRVAASHIRVGTFQYFAARGETQKVQQLADYVIARHYPELAVHKNPYLSLFEAVRDAQAALLAKWMLVGFVHGVMNTDNMTVSGETIDYGPCAFIDEYDPEAVFSSIDTNGRYAYSHQPVIAHWNLARLAETLLPLFHEDKNQALELGIGAVNRFADIYRELWLDGMRRKIGLTSKADGDLELASDLLEAMKGQNVDFTLLFHNLGDAVLERPEQALSLFDNPAMFEKWLVRWQERGLRDEMSKQDRAAAMNQINPLYIPRNHKVEEALTEAVSLGDYSKFETLNEVLSHPFKERPELEEFALPAPDSFGPYKTFCGT